MSILEAGLEKIYSECLEEQKHFINTICENVRGRKLDLLFDLKAFYVPNDEFMINYFGPSIMSNNFDCYDYLGYCKWKYHLVLPIRDVLGNVVGFSGYNPYVGLAKKEKNVDLGDQSQINDSNVFLGEEKSNDSNPSMIQSDKIDITTMSRYKESSAVVMDKSKFFICPLTLKKAIDDGYLILVDGFFDSLSLAQEGYNSMSVLGSTISEYMIFCLSLVKVIYVAYDNDSAGKKLYNTIKQSHNNVYSIVQSKCKDIDAFIKEYPNEFKEGMNQINSKIPMSFMLKA